MIELLNSVNREAVTSQPKFITLTYPSAWSPSWQDWKANLQAFRERLFRKYGKFFCVWKLELQQRGAPHFHLMAFYEHFIDYAWVARAWYEIVGSGDPAHLVAGTQVEAVRSWNGVLFYASKYLAKPVGESEGYQEGMGRMWGVWYVEQAHIRVQAIVLLLSEFHEVRRILVRYRRAQVKAGRLAVNASMASMYVFMSDRDAWRILQLVGVVT